MKIGIITDCMKRPSLKDALVECAKLKVDGVQIYATGGEFCPRALGRDKRRDYIAMLGDLGLEVSALCGDMGGFGFEKEEDNRERVALTKEIVALAAEFGAKAVTTHIGVIPSDKNHPRYEVMREALAECGRYAKSCGVTLAIETGPEKAATLCGFVRDAGEGVGVNLDPANFVMVTGQDPVEAVDILKDHIVHTHVKDGRMLKKIDPEEVYHAFAVGGIEELNACSGFKELPIGSGDVDWPNYLSALKNIGYDGYLTIEREAGEHPFEDISRAVGFIKDLIK